MDTAKITIITGQGNFSRRKVLAPIIISNIYKKLNSPDLGIITCRNSNYSTLDLSSGEQTGLFCTWDPVSCLHIFNNNIAIGYKDKIDITKSYLTKGIQIFPQLVDQQDSICTIGDSSSHLICISQQGWISTWKKNDETIIDKKIEGCFQLKEPFFSSAIHKQKNLLCLGLDRGYVFMINIANLNEHRPIQMIPDWTKRINCMNFTKNKLLVCKVNKPQNLLFQEFMVWYPILNCYLPKELQTHILKYIKEISDIYASSAPSYALFSLNEIENDIQFEMQTLKNISLDSPYLLKNAYLLSNDKIILHIIHPEGEYLKFSGQIELYGNFASDGVLHWIFEDDRIYCIDEQNEKCRKLITIEPVPNNNAT